MTDGFKEEMVIQLMDGLKERTQEEKKMWLKAAENENNLKKKESMWLLSLSNEEYKKNLMEECSDEQLAEMLSFKQIIDEDTSIYSLNE